MRNRSRSACTLFFVAGGIGIGAWAACLPLVSEAHQLSKSELGLVLLCFAFGAIVAMAGGGGLVHRYGPKRFSLVGALTFGISLAMVPHLSNALWLALVVALAGAAFGTLDVCMNTEAAHLEKRAGKHIMSYFHGMFSIGSFAGAGLCAQILLIGGDLAWCLGVTGTVVGVLCLVAWGLDETVAAMAEETNAASQTRFLSPLQKQYLFVIGMLAFLALFAEGALMDWTAIYLVDAAGATESAGAFGFALFGVSMAVGRLTGDAINNSLGPAILVRVGALLSGSALAVMLLLPYPYVVLGSLIFCGFGVANLVPAMFAAAGKIGGRAAGAAMSRVVAFGYTGLLMGPPVIGFVAQLWTLGISLWLVVLALVIISSASGPFLVGRP